MQLNCGYLMIELHSINLICHIFKVRGPYLSMHCTLQLTWRYDAD